MSEIHGEMIGYIEKDITHIEIVMINVISAIAMMQIIIITIISNGMTDRGMTMVITGGGTKTKKNTIEVMKMIMETMTIKREKNDCMFNKACINL
jgi:hypothetical protein